LHPIAMNTFIKNKPFEKTLDNLASRMEPAAPWQFLTGYYQYRPQLNTIKHTQKKKNPAPPFNNRGSFFLQERRWGPHRAVRCPREVRSQGTTVWMGRIKGDVYAIEAIKKLARKQSNITDASATYAALIW
ncbi:hypothetical protein KCA24_05370, partial [Escherichia coli]|nr:hypothetical protein [Escherichia coli]